MYVYLLRTLFGYMIILLYLCTEFRKLKQRGNKEAGRVICATFLIITLQI